MKEEQAMGAPIRSALRHGIGWNRGMIPKVKSRCCFLFDSGRSIPLVAILFAGLLISLPTNITAQSDSKSDPSAAATKQADGSSPKEPQRRSLTAGLKTVAPADDVSSKSLTEGLSNKSSEGDKKNGSTRRGSSTRRDPGAPKIDVGSAPKYKRLKKVQLDASLTKSALESAAKIDDCLLYTSPSPRDS